jgi:hypothetical protein
VHKTVIIASLILCSAGVAAPPKNAGAAKSVAASLPAFTFKNARAGVVMDPNSVGKCSPSDDRIAGKLSCGGADSVVAGVNLLLAPTYYFYNGRLTMMLFLYDNDGVNFLTFRQAFEEKYGPPCNSSTEKWQNRAGSTFDNPVVIWCFSTGKLKLEQLGPSLKYGSVTYTDEFNAPSKDTPKDF